MVFPSLPTPNTPFHTLYPLQHATHNPHPNLHSQFTNNTLKRIQPQSTQQTRLHFHSQPMKESRSFYFLHIPLPLFMSCTGWNMVRRALGECAPHFIQREFFTQSNYALMNTTAFIVYGLSKFITSHVVKGNLFRMYTLLFGMVGILCSLEGLASSSTTGNYSVFFALWVVGYACMGTLWPILCIVFKQWLPDDCTSSSSYQMHSVRILLVGDLLLQFDRDHSLQHAFPGCTRESELPLLYAKHCKPVQCICLLFSLFLETA